MERLNKVEVTLRSGNELLFNTMWHREHQGLLFYSVTVINNVVHKDWNLINIFKLCFDIFSSSYKSTCAAVSLKLRSFTALTVWTTHPLEADCVFRLLTTEKHFEPKCNFLNISNVHQHLKRQFSDQYWTPPSETGLNHTKNVVLTLVKEFCSNNIFQCQSTVSLTLVNW